MDDDFSGGVFSDQLETGRAGAEIMLTAAGVSARVPDGQLFSIPYRECNIEVGGHNGRMVFCRDSKRTVTIFCEDRKFPRALSTASSGTLDTQLGDAIKKVKQQSRRGTLIGVFSLAIILLLIVGGYWGVKRGARVAVHALPISVDRKLGRTAFASTDLGGPEISDKAIVGPIQKMVERLEPYAAIEGLDFEVHVVDSDEMNAFCLPGGVMVVYTGLISGAENADQVAAVVGHEMAHATLRHGLERTSQSIGIWAAVSLLIGDASGLIAGGADLFRVAVVNSYSREQEEAADGEGVRMLHAAGIDPSAMAKFFKIMEKQHGEVPKLLAWINTHPQHAARIATVTAIVDALPQREYTAVDVDWDDVKRRVKEIHQINPEDH